MALNIDLFCVVKLWFSLPTARCVLQMLRLCALLWPRRHSKRYGAGKHPAAKNLIAQRVHGFHVPSRKIITRAVQHSQVSHTIGDSLSTCPRLVLSAIIS